MEKPDLSLFCGLLLGSEFVCPDRLPTGRTQSSDLESHWKLSTPVSSNVLRQRNAAVPHTVGHCHIKRLSFLSSLSAGVPEYQRDPEASRSVVGNIISSQTWGISTRAIVDS